MSIAFLIFLQILVAFAKPLYDPLTRIARLPWRPTPQLGDPPDFEHRAPCFSLSSVASS